MNRVVGFWPVRWPLATAALSLALASTSVPYLEAQGPVATGASNCGAPGTQQVASAAKRPAVGVLYFAGGSTRGDDPQLADAVTTAVVSALSRANGMTVMRGDQWVRAATSPAYVLTGHVGRTQHELRVRVRLNEARSGDAVWTAEFTRPVLELPLLGSTIAAEAARRVGAVPDTAPVPPIPLSLAAYDQLLLGEYSLTRWDTASMRRAVEALALSTGLSGGDPVTYARYAVALGKAGEWGYGAHPADSLLHWGSVTALLAAERFEAAGDSAGAAGAYALAAELAALHGDGQRARSLVARAEALDRAHPSLARARALIALPGNQAAATSALRSVGDAGHLPALLDRAMLALTARRDTEACQALDAAIASDPRSAPAYALRALLRMRSGDMRGGWADAEMARQLGRPLWGDALDLLAAARVAERQEILQRVQRFVSQVRADSSELSVLDARLAAIALTAAGREEDARAVLARMRRSDPRRSLTLGESPPRS